MARAKSAKSANDVSATVTQVTAAAAANALRLAAEAGNGPNSADRADTIARLARMCEEAADHMARAQDVLFDGHEGGEEAINHLDAALQCLQTLASEGEQHVARKQSKAQTA